MKDKFKSRPLPKPNNGFVTPGADPAVTASKDVARQPREAQVDDPGYFQSRAEEEVIQAQQATDPAAVTVHYELAERYLERVTPNPAERRSAS